MSWPDTSPTTALPDPAGAPQSGLLAADAPQSLPTLPGGWTVRAYRLAGHTLRMHVPTTPDALLDDPEVLAAHARDGYMPYWAYLWPTSLDMAAAVLEENWARPLRVLEIGCGLGLVGVAAARAGHAVVCSDYDPTAVRVALTNAAFNGCPDVTGLRLDWRAPGAERFPLILGCDLIYERANHAPILNLLAFMLAPDGAGWLADPERHQADSFVELARQKGWDVTCRRLARQPFPTRPDGFTNLWIVRRGAAGSAE